VDGMIYYTEDELNPEQRYIEDAGFDLKAAETTVIPAGKTVAIHTGVSMQIPRRMVGIIKDRSSMALQGLFVHGGVIDSGYEGEIKVILYNSTDQDVTINKYQRIAQIMLFQIRPERFRAQKGTPPQISERGTNGFGSTGK